MTKRFLKNFLENFLLKYSQVQIYLFLMNFSLALGLLVLGPICILNIFFKTLKIILKPDWTKIFKGLYEKINIKLLLSFTGFIVLFFIIISFSIFYFSTDYNNWNTIIKNKYMLNSFIINNYKLVLTNDITKIFSKINFDLIPNVTFNTNQDNYFYCKSFIFNSHVKSYLVYFYIFLIIILIFHTIFGLLGLSFDYFLKNYAFVHNFFVGFAGLQVFFIILKFWLSIFV